MKKLTKQFRNKVYKTCLKDLYKARKTTDFYFMCWTFHEEFNYMENNFNLTIDDLPELKSFKPETKRSCWFDASDYKSREIVLKECIKLTNPIKRVKIKVTKGKKLNISRKISLKIKKKK